MSFFGVEARVEDGAQPERYDFEADASALDPTIDEKNDETFGKSGPVGKDFDFAGHTANVANTLDEEAVTYERRAQSHIPSLQPLASLWQTSADPNAFPPQTPQQPMSVQDLENMMRSMPMPGMQMHPQEMAMGMHPQGMPMGMPPMGMPGMHGMPPMGMPPHPGYQPWGYGAPMMPGMMPPHMMGHMPPGQAMMPPGMQPPFPEAAGPVASEPPAQTPEAGSKESSAGDSVVPEAAAAAAATAPAIPKAPKGPKEARPSQEPKEAKANAKASTQSAEGNRETPYSLNRSGGRPTRSFAETRSALQAQATADREKQQARDRQRVSRSRYCGLMGDWDKNFIMRLQLQQLVSQDPDNDDFYYQVHSTIQKNRSSPQQPLNAFAKIYLRGQGQRQRPNRRNERQALLQQVKEVVEKVRNRTPKERAVHEGTLGAQPTVGNAVRPRKALALQTGQLDTRKTTSNIYRPADIPFFIEAAFDAVLDLEAHDRIRPPPDSEYAADWAAEIPELQDKLWESLKVLDPVDPNKNQPFVMMLNHNKGKKLLPRAFPHLDNRRRLTVFTRMVSAIDQLDVVRNGAYVDDQDLPAVVRKAIDVFSQTVLPPIVHLISEAELGIVTGFFDILLSSENLLRLTQTKVGQTIFTVLISRAELILQEQPENEADSETEAWKASFAKLFNAIKGDLGSLFPPRQVDNSYVWHFLASLALTADLSMQRELVDGVRDRIFSTISEAKALPVDVGTPKITNLNMFLNVMGLNATFDDITEL